MFLPNILDASPLDEGVEDQHEGEGNQGLVEHHGLHHVPKHQLDHATEHVLGDFIISLNTSLLNMCLIMPLNTNLSMFLNMSLLPNMCFIMFHNKLFLFHFTSCFFPIVLQL